MDDAGLTEFGAAQARAAAAGIAREKVDAIYVSPLRRARETARPLAEATGIEPVIVEGLAEIRAGTGGLSQSEADRYFVAAMERPLERFWVAAWAVVNLRPVGDLGCLWSFVNFNEIDPLRSAGLR